MQQNMILMEEETPFNTPSSNNILEQPRSFRWQIFQGAHYVIGSLCFTAGSCMYFTQIFRSYLPALTIGGWLFTIGSLVFLFADLQDWWDYRTGYCFSHKYLPLSVNESLDLSLQSDQTEIEINVYGSMCGSALYLAGSILFIPIFENYLSIGEWFFILGSTFCYLSLSWKIYRSVCMNSTDHKFHFFNLLKNLPTLTIDIISIIGNLCFFIGTILFLPYVNKTDIVQNRAAFFFVFGSACFTLSSFILQYIICYPPRR
jgi:hypothetical protein